jgi:DNA repair exonuclease SbcCD nuclease subunit
MSTDRGPIVGDEYKSEGIYWWRREIPTNVEWEYAHRNLAQRDYKVDFIITHDVPDKIYSYYNYYLNDPVSQELEKIRLVTDFKYWFCGHIHVDDDIPFQKISILYNRQPVNVKNYLSIDLEGGINERTNENGNS